MGNDGGSIPTRRELVKEAARNPTTAQIKESLQEQQEYGWTIDPVSRDPLTRPVVSDATGRLYNKSTILEYLVEGARKDDVETITQGSIRNLKDIVEVKFELDDAATSAEKSEVWKCPVTNDRLGPKAKAVYLVPCGHAFSGTAVKEVSGKKCLTCDTEFAENDAIPILPSTTADVARLTLRLKHLQEQGLTHSLKKATGSKKRKKEKEEEGAAENNGRGKETAKAVATGINNASTASLAAKVMQEQEKSKRQRLQNENVKSLFSSRDQSKPVGKSADFMTRGFTVPAKSK